MGTSSRSVAVLATLWCACGTGDTRVDPGDLELRDLLGVAPSVAAGWNAEQRAAARRVIDDSLRDAAANGGGSAMPIALGAGDAATLDDRVARALANLDAARFADGATAFGVVRIGSSALVPIATAESIEDARAVDASLEVSETWSKIPGDLVARGAPVLSALAAAAGHRDGDGEVIATPVPRLAVIAGYVAEAGEPAHLVVNPIVLAALEPPSPAGVGVTPPKPVVVPAPARARVDPMAIAPPGELGTRAQAAEEAIEHAVHKDGTGAGNPYSFYGSYEECADAQQARCTSCLAANNCVPITNDATGDAECQALGSNSGRGYFLICINLALAIDSVDTCTASADGTCAQSQHAVDSLTTLEANSDFLDQSACSSAIDGCLAKIYGAPPAQFPGPDGGVTPTQPPRSTSVSCGNSCSSPNSQLSPDCSCAGPSCANTLSCDNACSSSDGQDDSCGDCSDDTDGSDDTASSSGCGNNSDDNSSCDSCGSDSCSNDDSCGSGCSNDDSCGSGCSDSGGGCGNSGDSNCNVAKARSKAKQGTGYAGLIATGWSCLPVMIALVVRRRARKRGGRSAEVRS